jgi:hypothetical protein
VDQAVLSLERTIGSRWKVALVFVHRTNRDMVALVDRNLASNYTVVENVMVFDRYGQPVFFGGQPLVLEKLAISNEDILAVQELVKHGILTDPRYIYAPPDLTQAQLDALRYDPDFVLTAVRAAARRFGQLQLRVETRYRTWWAAGSATVSTLKGNFNVVTGPDDYTTGGPGPWVRLNEQYNYYGALNNQSRFEGKMYLVGLLPAHLRGSIVLSYATGDRVTPTMIISSLGEVDFVPPVSNPAPTDTLPFHRFLFRSTAGHRIFVRPRGTYRYEGRTSLDLHLERSFARARGQGELLVTVDGFNVLGDASVTGIQIDVSRDYGRVRSRVAPRTLRLGAGVRF